MKTKKNSHLLINNVGSLTLHSSQFGIQPTTRMRDFGELRGRGLGHLGGPDGGVPVGAGGPRSAGVLFHDAVQVRLPLPRPAVEQGPEQIVSSHCSLLLPPPGIYIHLTLCTLLIKSLIKSEKCID